MTQPSRSAFFGFIFEQTHLNLNIEINVVLFKIVIPGDGVFISFVLNCLTFNTQFFCCMLIFHRFLPFHPTWLVVSWEENQPRTFYVIEIALANISWAFTMCQALSILHVWTHLCLTATLWGGQFYYPCFIDW